VAGLGAANPGTASSTFSGSELRDGRDERKPTAAVVADKALGMASEKDNSVRNFRGGSVEETCDDLNRFGAEPKDDRTPTVGGLERCRGAAPEQSSSTTSSSDLTDESSLLEDAAARTAGNMDRVPSLQAPCALLHDAREPATGGVAEDDLPGRSCGQRRATPSVAARG